MSTEVLYVAPRKGKCMAMEDLLDLLQDAREKCGIVGITQKSREEQGVILRGLMHKFDAEDNKKMVLDSKWGLDKKRKGTDPDEEVNVLECRKKKCCKKCQAPMDVPTIIKKWNGSTSCHEYSETWETCKECEGKISRTC